MAKNRLFKKLFITNILIILITMIILSGFFYLMFQNYYFAEKEKIMIEEGQQLNMIISGFTVGDVDVDKLNQELSVVDRLINATIWIVSRDGLIYSQSSHLEKNWVGITLSKDEIENILKGHTIIKRGYFGGRFSQPVLTVGLPLKISGSIKGAIFMHAPILEMNKTLMNIFFIMIISMVIAIFIGGILISFASKKISEPLKEMSSAALKMAKGDFSTKIQVAGDDEITDLAISFNKMSRELEQMEDVRKEFVANVSHELRSPLTTIQGYIDGIIDGTIPQDSLIKYLKIVQEETRRMSRLISGLLDITKMESGKFPLYITDFDINELIRITIIKMESRINEKRVHVKVDFDYDKNIVQGDKDKIEQVLTNLFDNAIKFSEVNGYIHVYTERKGSKLYITIHNMGEIIPEEDIEHIWDKLYKVDKSRSGNTGAGLGLYIVKNIINKHDEEIWAESKENEGTTITFTMKLKND
ncbi:HAMP domain-containing protein [Aceticella autotrophica]|uniref:histidine kinase n=1 Tax=Aceticella autotrophica TaxID=2755338 RepID=A0A975AVX8_9THEO|nr:HAMP domain-containing sensor histidine kinase [Aceticella autotrophica]QSZ27469.1 HAMP domain-containing protein [Aceticella autotrophica]